MKLLFLVSDLLLPPRSSDVWFAAAVETKDRRLVWDGRVGAVVSGDFHPEVSGSTLIE